MCAIETFLQVLILILLEYGLQPAVDFAHQYTTVVLILILLEYGLQPMFSFVKGDPTPVLILILLEYGLQLVVTYNYYDVTYRLNPYSTGIWSATSWCQSILTHRGSLNPYSTGIWSATFYGNKQDLENHVLILILLEYGLQHSRKKPLQNISGVLILILLEYGLQLALVTRE